MTDNNDPKKQMALSPAIVEKIVSNQAKELELREKEIEQASISLKNSHEFSLASLQAQKEDRSEQRIHEARNTKNFLWFSLAIIVGLFILFGLAMKYNKDQIVMEIIKAILYIGSGALGGYSWGSKGKKSTIRDNE